MDNLVYEMSSMVRNKLKCIDVLQKLFLLITSSRLSNLLHIYRYFALNENICLPGKGKYVSHKKKYLMMWIYVISIFCPPNYYCKIRIYKPYSFPKQWLTKASSNLFKPQIYFRNMKFVPNLQKEVWEDHYSSAFAFL